ncbi:MAG: DUF6314 family protein [Solirubrobacteraceae bacterium]|nr:DUF6314 family protein [Patulibacter sp.]
MSSVPAEPFRVDPADLPAWLAGTWSVDRDINDGQGAFTGTATFEPQPGGTVRWAEEGSLQLGDFTGPATRVLFLHPADPWEVRFDDGRLFHPLDLSGGGFAAEHPCGPDLYRGTYDPRSDDELLVHWHVTGPGREDDIVSRYRRVG